MFILLGCFEHKSDELEWKKLLLLENQKESDENITWKCRY